MLESVKHEINLLKRSRPGHRFQDRHERAKRSGGSVWAKVARVGGGLAIAALGVFLMPAPGPGWLIFILGLSLVGSDIGFVARGLDAAELKVRAAASWAKKFWKNASTPVRVIVAILLLALAGAIGYGLYLFMTR